MVEPLHTHGQFGVCAFNAMCLGFGPKLGRA